MTEIKTFSINDGVSLKCFTDSRFKTLRVSFHMLVPLSKKTVSENAILPSLVSRATKKYPNYSALSCRLSDLYGATLNSGVSKMGDYQILSLTVGGISSRYALNNENMLEELSGLLFDIILNPLKDEDGLFPLDGFEQEKRQILELLDAEINDKAVYARNRCEEILFENEPAGIRKYGKKADIEALNRENLSVRWEKLLKTAKFEIFVSGDCSPSISGFKKMFSHLGKAEAREERSFTHNHTVKNVTEDMAVSQSKLVMAFRAKVNETDRTVFRLMSAVFGGTPSSKLFVNVREKMGLCYYCSSRMDIHNDVLFVESGVETVNVEKARKEIINQFEMLRSGNISEEEIESAKLALCNSLNGVTDSLGAVEGWYLSQTFNNKFESPKESSKKIMSITKKDIVKAANKLSLDTVYCLRGNGEK